MGSISATCEISEVREELDYVPRSGKASGLDAGIKEGKLPVLRLGPRDSIEDDINQLFESFNLRNSSKHASPSHQAAASPLRKNALKKPITVGVSRSPRIGSSEPVTLKQALRDLCLSKASEMASMRRLSKSINSPRISEAGRIKNLYDKKIVDGNESTPSSSEGKGSTLEISLVPEESSKSSHVQLPQEITVGVTEDVVNDVIGSSTNPGGKSFKPEMIQKGKQPAVAPLSSNSFEGQVKNSQKPEIKTSIHRAHSPRSLAAKLYSDTPMDPTEEDENVPASSQVVVQTLKELVEQQENVPTSTSSSGLKDGDDVLEPQNNASVSNKLGNKSALPKSGRRVRPQNLHARVVKTGIRSKNIIKKKVKQDLVSEELVETVDEDPNIDQLVCKRCLCSMQSGSLDANPTAEVILTNVTNVKSGTCKPDPASNYPDSSKIVVKPIGGNSRSRDKGEFSQSSKSSIGEYSSSTASLSDESNLSRSSCSNRPHMSKDVRWEAIRHVRRQRGVLGLNNFNLLKKLGSGDIGTVYLAELIGTSCLFAIKVMDNEFLARRKKMPRAQTEREIMRMLDHPFLPTLYSQFTSDNLSCLVMEYCPGGDLHVLRQKQPGRHFVEPAARFYVAEVLLALEYLHMLGVVYRDLKPENILVRDDGHIMLTDFDLSLRCTVSPTLLQSSQLAEPARVSGPCTGSNCAEPFCMAHSCRVPCFSPRILPPSKNGKPKPDPLGSLPQLVAEPTDARSNSFVGTHEYLAPEIIKGEGHGAAVDWWTFGIFLYELLYGKTPFKGSGNEETLANVVLQSLKFPDSPNVSFEAQDLIRGLLVKDPDHRLGTQKGAAEIKQHRFFEGLSWALIRCAIPPELPESYDFGVRYMAAPQEMESKYLEFKAAGEQLEFELF